MYPCPRCGTVFTSRGFLYQHQVLTREIVVSPWEFKRTEQAAAQVRAAARVTYTR